MRTFLRPALSLLAVAAALSGGAVALATPPQEASGTFVLTAADVTEVHEAGANVIIEQDVVYVLTDTFAGAAQGEERLVIHPNGKVTLEGWVVCDCTVDSMSGDVTFRYNLTAEGGSFEGRFTVASATGELTSLRSQGTFGGADGAGTYAGRVHFDP